MRETSRPEFFPRISKTYSSRSDSDEEELLRLIGNSENVDQEPNIYRLIDENKLEEIKSLIAKDGDVLNVKDQTCGFPILYAIKNGNNAIVIEFIRSNKEVLKQKDDKGFNPFFYAIFYNNLDLIDYIIEKKPEIIDEKFGEDYFPIFYAIKKQKNACAIHIINQNPQILQKKDIDGSSLLDYAIKCENLEMIKFFIEHDQESLKDPEKHPIFYAIANNKIKALEEILKLCPESLEYENDLRLNPLLFLIQKYLENQLLGEDLKDVKSLINVIYKKQLNSENDISEEELQSLADYYKDFMPAMFGYTKSDFGALPLTRSKIYKNLLSQLSQEVAKEMDQNKKLLLDSINKTADKINVFEAIETDKENIFIYESGIRIHLSYFVFHVNKITNKLTHISYCDGNNTKNDWLDNERDYIWGVKKYKVCKDIEFTEEFVEDFLSINSRNKTIGAFFNQIAEGKIRDKSGDIILDSLDECSIPTKIQNKRNCAYKTTKIMWRFIAILHNPELNFYLKEDRDLFLENDEGKNSEQSDSVVDERIIFKEIKAELVEKAIQNLFELVRSFEDEKDKINPDLKIYLQEKIQKLFDEIEVHSEEKIAKILDEPSPNQKEIKIHQRIQSLVLPKRSMSPIQDDDGHRVVKKAKLAEVGLT
jgi:ankyrin repeat protein